MKKEIKPSTPGEILLEEFLQPLNVSQNQLARSTHLPPSRINDIIQGKRSITADTAVRFGLYFNVSPDFWVNAQADYDLRIAKRKLPEVIKEVEPYAA